MAREDDKVNEEERTINGVIGITNEEWTYIPEEMKKAWHELPEGWFERDDIDIDPLVLEEMVINGLVYKKVIDVSITFVGKQRTFDISYHKL